MQTLESTTPLGAIIPNLAQMLQRNVNLYGDKMVCREMKNGAYTGISWNELYHTILRITSNLRRFGFTAGDKMVIFSPNRMEMLELELAVMASGGIAVPIFAYFHQETAELLINHSDAKHLAVAGELQLGRVSDIHVKNIFVFDKTSANGDLLES